MRSSHILLTAVVALVAACGPKDDGLGRQSSTSAPKPTATAPSASSVTIDPELPPSQCAVDVAPLVQGRAHFERGPAGSRQDEWSLVLSLEPPPGASYDAARAPAGFGSIDAPAASMDGGNIVLRARARFTSNAYATFVVAVRCASVDGTPSGKDDETGLLSAGIRWTDGDLEPEKTIDVLVAPFGGR